jgi:uncharacterized protein (TIGR03086 family)
VTPPAGQAGWPLAGTVELLERSLGYTRRVLADVAGDDLHLPTPCAGWDLGQLLAHLDDALDAFTEAAGGGVAGPAPWSIPRSTPWSTPGLPLVARIQAKAQALLGAWSGWAPSDVDVAGRPVAGELLVATAALEVAVHGWDVGEALGGAPPIPPSLAERLLDLARWLVQPEDRTVRFARPHSVPAAADEAERLLAFLGRTGHPGGPAPGKITGKAGWEPPLRA